MIRIVPPSRSRALPIRCEASRGVPADKPRRRCTPGLDGRRMGVPGLGCCPGPARPLRPHRSDDPNSSDTPTGREGQSRRPAFSIWSRNVQTETECGNLYWKAGFNPDKPQNDWDYGSYTWGKIRSFISLGANSYMLWNMVLDREGKNIDSVKPWPQNAAVVVNTSDRSVTYTAIFYMP